MPPRARHAKTLKQKIEALERSYLYRAAGWDGKFEMLLEYAGINELREGGFLWDAATAAKRAGYTPQHFRTLCKTGKVDSITRGFSQEGEEVLYLFLPAMIKPLFRFNPARSSSSPSPRS